MLTNQIVPDKIQFIKRNHPLNKNSTQTQQTKRLGIHDQRFDLWERYKTSSSTQYHKKYSRYIKVSAAHNKIKADDKTYRIVSDIIIRYRNTTAQNKKCQLTNSYQIIHPVLNDRKRKAHNGDGSERKVQTHGKSTGCISSI